MPDPRTNWRPATDEEWSARKACEFCVRLHIVRGVRGFPHWPTYCDMPPEFDTRLAHVCDAHVPGEPEWRTEWTPAWSNRDD